MTPNSRQHAASFADARRPRRQRREETDPVGGAVGRASNRKKAQRQAGLRERADAETQQAMRLLAGVLQTLIEEERERNERETSARRAWYVGTEPSSAEAPRWLEDSLGDRFFGGIQMEEARTAPCLAGAVPCSDVLPVGLAILSAPAQLCRSASASLLQPIA